MERQTHKSMKKLELILHVECYTMRKFITHSLDELAMYIPTVIVKIKKLQELFFLSACVNNSFRYTVKSFHNFCMHNKLHHRIIILLPARGVNIVCKHYSYFNQKKIQHFPNIRD